MRLDILQALICKFKYQSYLEIGVYRGDCFRKINIECKDGVDPSPVYSDDKRIHIMTSDQFFESLSKDKIYDLIFIDGLHDHQQGLKDINNALEHLSEDGTIVLHDCNPPNEWQQREISDFDGTGKFNGIVWRSFVETRAKRGNLNMFVVDCDWGIGVIQRSDKQDFLKFKCNNKDDITSYKWLEKNRKMALNLISSKDFNNWIANEK